MEDKDFLHFLQDIRRDTLNLTRKEACSYFSEDLDEGKLEKIERGDNKLDLKYLTEIVSGYKKCIKDRGIKDSDKINAVLNLCNTYCCNECPVGKEKEMCEIHTKELSQITLETIVLLKKVSVQTDRLAEITLDGKISNNELVDFVKIKRDLEHISMTVDSLKLWTDQMISSGNIDEVEYNRVKQEIEESEN